MITHAHSVHQSGSSDWTTESFLVCVCECSSYTMNVSWTEQHVRQFQCFMGNVQAALGLSAGRTVSLSNKQTRGYQFNLFLFSTEVLNDFRSPSSRARSPGSHAHSPSARARSPGSRAHSPGSCAHSPSARALLIRERRSCSERLGLIKM